MRYYILQDPETKKYISTRWGSMAKSCEERGATPVVVLSGWNIVPTFAKERISAKEFCQRIDKKFPETREFPDIKEVFMRKKGDILAIVSDNDNKINRILDTEKYLNDEVNLKTHKKFGVGIRVHF